MSYSLNKINSVNMFTSLKTTQDKTEDDNLQKSQKKKQIVCEREGNYYCTYMVDDKGQKILIKRIPAADNDNKKNQTKQSDTPEAKISNNRINSSPRSTFEYKQEMKTQAVHKENLQQMMSLLKEYAGIPGDTGKTYEY